LKESSKRNAMDLARLRRTRIADERAKVRERERERAASARPPGGPGANGAPPEVRRKKRGRGRPRKDAVNAASRQRDARGRKRMYDRSTETCAECGTHQTPQWRSLSAQFAVLERAGMLNAVVCNRCYARAKRRSQRLAHPQTTTSLEKVDGASAPADADALGALCAAVDL
jgi:ribosomal protein L37E